MELKYFQEVASFIGWPVAQILSFIVWEIRFEDIQRDGNMSTLGVVLTFSQLLQRLVDSRSLASRFREYFLSPQLQIEDVPLCF